MWSRIVLSPGEGLTWKLGFNVKLHGDWSARYLFWKDDGTFVANLKKATMAVSLSVRVSESGRPAVKTEDCNCETDEFTFGLNSRWIFTKSVSVMKPLRYRLQQKLCKAITLTINAAADELRTLPFLFPVGKDWMFDCRMISPPAITSRYVETFHKGELLDKSYWSTVSSYPPSLPSRSTADRMVTVWISEHVFNTAGHLWHHNSKMPRFSMGKEQLPETSRDLLNTTCSQANECFGALVPQVGEKYPNSSVEVELTSTEQPTTNITPDAMIVTFGGFLTVRARRQDDSLVDLFEVKVILKASLKPRIDENLFEGASQYRRRNHDRYRKLCSWRQISHENVDI